MVNPKKVISRKKQSKSHKLNEEYKFEHPLHSPGRACLQFVCQNNRFPAWQKALKLRYWLHFGLKDDSGYFMDWKDTKTKTGDTTQHLISISSISENGDVVENVKLFTLNIYIMKKKIMLQGTHREVWLKNEFNLLKKLVDDCVEGKNMAESYFLMTGVKIPVDNNDDLIPSDDEEDPGHLVDLLEVRPESLPLPSDTDENEDEDDIVLNITSSRRKFKTPT